MTSEEVRCLKLSGVVRWYERKDFMDFIRGRRPNQFGRPASWHDPTEDDYEDFSDVFVTFDHEDGSDREAIPPDIWEEICQICRNAGMEYGLVWITPMLDSDDAATG